MDPSTELRAGLFRPLPGAILRDVRSGRVWHLDRGDQWVLGRTRGTTEIVNEELVTHLQLEIRWDGARWMAGDPGADGTTLHGTTLGSPRQVFAGDDIHLANGMRLRFETGATPPRESRAPSAMEDVQRAISERDALLAAPALAGYSRELLEGKREMTSALAAVKRLKEIGDADFVAPVRALAIATAVDAKETGLRALAALSLAALVSTGAPDSEGQRVLLSLRRDPDPFVRGAVLSMIVED